MGVSFFRSSGLYIATHLKEDLIGHLEFSMSESKRVTMVRSTKIASLSNLPCFFFKRFQGVFACNVLTSLLFISTFESQCSTMIDSVYVNSDQRPEMFVQNGVDYGWREGWIAPSYICTVILRQCKKLQNTQSEEVYVHSKAWHDMNCMLMKLNWCPIDLYC